MHVLSGLDIMLVVLEQRHVTLGRICEGVCLCVYQRVHVCVCVCVCVCVSRLG